MLVTSRSFEEYVAFFGLTDDDLDRRVLDCCAGAPGFAAVLAQRGSPVVALDPAYAGGPDLRGRGHRAETVPVGYEFQRGADRMLVVRRG